MQLEDKAQDKKRKQAAGQNKKREKPKKVFIELSSLNWSTERGRFGGKSRKTQAEKGYSKIKKRKVRTESIGKEGKKRKKLWL